MAYVDSLNKNFTNYTLCGFNNVLLCTDSISSTKNVTFPMGFDKDTNMSFKVVFVNGHNCIDASTPLTITPTFNGVADTAIPVVVNQYGTLIPLPIHEITSGTYQSLQPNATLEMYYTSDYDGSDNPAFVVIGNPIVLSSSDYTIYADGSMKDCPPLGATYVQYPKTKSPAEIWFLATWQELNYGGAFFRANGGNSETFENIKTVISVSGTTLTIADSGAKEGSVIYDFENNESRLITNVVTNASGDTVTIDSAFTSPNITNVLIAQDQQLASHKHTMSLPTDISEGWGPVGFSLGAQQSSTSVDVGNASLIAGVSGTVGNENRPNNFTIKVWKRTN